MKIGDEVIIWSHFSGNFGLRGIIKGTDLDVIRVEHFSDASSAWYNIGELEKIGVEIFETPCIKAKLPWKKQ